MGQRGQADAGAQVGEEAEMLAQREQRAAFRLDVGRYPRQGEALGALVSNGTQIGGWRGPYLKRNTLLNDPWNRPYLYVTRDDGGGFILTSYGADGAAGGIDDKADLVFTSAP